MTEFKVGDRVRVDLNSYKDNTNNQLVYISQFAMGIVRFVSDRHIAVQTFLYNKDLYGAATAAVKVVPPGYGGWFDHGAVYRLTESGDNEISLSETKSFHLKIDIDRVVTADDIESIISELNTHLTRMKS